MLTDEIKQKIEAATVKIIMEDDGFGSGVLIPGRMILTATHCVQHTADGGMAIEDYYIETLETSQGFLKALRSWWNAYRMSQYLVDLTDKRFGMS